MGGLLAVGSGGVLYVFGGSGISAIEEGTVAGMPSWRITPVSQLLVPSYIAFGEQVESPTVPIFFLRFTVFSLSPLKVDFFITDGSGVVLNPKLVMGDGATIGHFHVHQGGTQVLSAAPPGPGP